MRDGLVVILVIGIMYKAIRECYTPGVTHTVFVVDFLHMLQHYVLIWN